MTGAAYTLTYDDADLVAGLEGLRALGADPSPLLEDIGAYGVASTQERFELGVDPDGLPWPQSIRAREQGGQTLVDRGHLRDSQTWNLVGDGAVEWGSNKVYAAIHQAGGVIHAKDGGKLRFTLGQREIFVDQVTIPKRAYLGLSDADRTEIEQLGVLALARAVAGGEGRA